MHVVRRRAIASSGKPVSHWPAERTALKKKGEKIYIVILRCLNAAAAAAAVVQLVGELESIISSSSSSSSTRMSRV